MKRALSILAFFASSAKAQTMYKMESIPVYDSVGNVYQTRQVFDHLPTKEDSVRFEREARSYVAQMTREHRQGRGVVSHKAVVAEVRTHNGRTMIKPTTKFRSPWYRYFDSNVKVGDTIWISRQDAIEPKF